MIFAAEVSCCGKLSGFPVEIAYTCQDLFRCPLICTFDRCSFWKVSLKDRLKTLTGKSCVQGRCSGQSIFCSELYRSWKAAGIRVKGSNCFQNSFLRPVLSDMLTICPSRSIYSGGAISMMLRKILPIDFGDPLVRK